MCFFPSKEQFQKWNLPNKYTAIGLLLAIFTGILLPLSCHLVSGYKIKRLKPKLTFDVQSLSDNKIYFSIEANNNHGCKIDRLFFNLDLPGTFDTFNLRIKQNVDNFSYSKRFRRGSGDDTISEMINFEIKDFYPHGYFDGYINIKPPKARVETLGKSIVNYPTPHLDLQDYVLYTIIYTYNGTPQTINDTFSLINVDYIKQDKFRRETQYSIIKKSLKDCLYKNKSSDNSDEFTKYIDSAIQYFINNSNKFSKNDTFIILDYIDTMTTGDKDTTFHINKTYILNDTLYQTSNLISRWIYNDLDRLRKAYKKKLDL